MNAFLTRTMKITICLTSLLTSLPLVAREVVQAGSVCTVTPLGASSDDTPQIKRAFSQCSKDSQIIFQEGTYNIRQVKEFTNLKNLCGTDIALRGHRKALFDGNVQAWIDENRGGSNRKGRPINLTIWRVTNVFVDGITWRQSQFWHTFVAYSKNVTMTDLDMRTRSNSQWSAVNTDGIDTWNSEDVTIRNWTDCISVKGNSKNILAQNITCYESGCAVIGSIANGATQTVENTYPGQGHVRNVTFCNFEFSDVDQPIYVTSCIYSGQNCDGSRLPIEGVTWENVKGTSPRRGGGGTGKVLCSNIKGQADMGLACTGTCPAGWPQQLKGNR
ncbi:putative glycoside hydrolase family 28 protein [Rhypophila decipiens]|uniref:galacturonan 1,4-alpha-galacturonidase n=1 Tax=Rhypophila decipiens TaxID=261697 RepID=A0AAN7B184_9PEZI|nr:putative glycoside hydrolase family 28 protein [Rhypophila decipiens]